MKNKRTSTLKTVLLSTLILITSQASQAEHFHYFIDIETHFSVDQNNQLNAFEVSWIYDENMSDLMKKQNPDFDALGKATMKDLGKKHYFTNIKLNGNPVKTRPAKEYRLQEISDEKGRKALQLDFLLPLEQPINMKGNNTIEWNFVDTSGVGIMVYGNQQQIRLGNMLRTHCTPSLIENKKADHGDPAQFLTLKCSI